MSEENNILVDEEIALLDSLLIDKELEKGEYYLNNKRIPRNDINFEWTPQMVAEIKKCKKDIRYFAENFFYVVTLEEGKVKIPLYPAQKRILKGLVDHRFNIICASRQIGKTTLMTIFALWMACFEDYKRIIIVANKEKTSIMILRRIQLAYQELPNWLKPGAKGWGSTELLFDNGSSIGISTTTGSAIRGEATNVLIIDEMAHIEPHLMEDFWASVIPAISSSRKTKIFAVSTPKGTGNKFYEIYTQAERGELANWHHERVDWWEFPGRGKKWQREMLDALGGDKQLFEQEFNNCFLESGDSAIDKDVTNHLRAMCREPEYVMEDGHYKIWFDPNPKHIYVIGVDVSEGIGKASSVAQVFDITDLTNIHQVAIYQHNAIGPLYFAKILEQITNHWGRPPVMIERNGPGQDVITYFKENIRYDKVLNYGPIDPDTGKPDLGESRPGIYNHTSTKYKGVMNMRYWINSMKVVNIYDMATIQEIETFVRYPNGHWKKKPGENIWDDRVMAMVWALFILEDPLTTIHFDVIEYDERGKPLSIRLINVENQRYYQLDPIFKVDGAPLPAIINNAGPYGGVEMSELFNQGWSVLR